MDAALPIPVLPRPAQLFSRALPPLLLEAPLAHLLHHAFERHPGLLTRLGDHAGKRFVIDADDLAFSILIEPARRRLKVMRKGSVTGDARLSGPLAAFLGLVHGAYDGDALFFSRDLVVEGDTAAVLALRNAIDDAEIDLSQEVLAALGPLRRFVTPAFRRALPLAERVTGVALSRKLGSGF